MNPQALLLRIGLGLGLVAAISIGAWIAWNHYTGLITDLATTRIELDRADRALEVAIGAAEAEREDRLRVDQLLAGRQVAINQLGKDLADYAQKLNDANRDPAARQWLDAPVPRGVWCGLHQRPAAVDCDQDRAREPAGAAGARHADAGAAGRDWLRLDRVFASARGGARELQH